MLLLLLLLLLILLLLLPDFIYSSLGLLHLIAGLLEDPEDCFMRVLPEDLLLLHLALDSDNHLLHHAEHAHLRVLSKPSEKNYLSCLPC